MSPPLLTTKLHIPPLRPGLVPRPRLIERLNAGLHRKLTLVSAPAGFGKTTLVAEWMNSAGVYHHPEPDEERDAPFPVKWRTYLYAPVWVWEGPAI